MEKFGLVVIGGGLSGLIAASLCSKAGLKVLVLEKEQSLGGRVGDSNQFTNGFRFFTNKDILEKVLSIAEVNVEIESVEAMPLIYEHNKKRLQTWEKSFGLEYPEKFFSNTVKHMPKGGLFNVINSLKENIFKNGGKIRTLDPIINVEIDELSFVKSIKTARGEEIGAEHFLYSSHPASLIPLTSKDALSSKFLKKMARLRPYPCLILEHELTEKFYNGSEVIYIPLSSKDDNGYLIGGFPSNWMGVSGNIGSWILPLSEDQYADNHQVSLIIKNCRRVLNKVFENYTDKIKFEKVAAVSNAFPSMDEVDLELPEFRNMKFIGDASSFAKDYIWQERAVLSAIEASKEIANVTNI